MKKIYILLFAMAIAGCEDFLEQDIRSNQNYDNYFQSEEDLVRFANGMYGSLITWTWSGGGLFFNNFWVLQDLAADNTYETGPSVDYHDLSNFTYDANNMIMDWIWEGCYHTINSSNVLLTEIEKMQQYSSPEVKNHLQGEAYFIRGMLYFELVKLFGDIPLQLFPTTEIEGTKLTRSPAADVYASVISDLTNAAELLKVNPYKDRVLGVPTSETASTLLAKAYLTRGALNNDQNDFDEAAASLEKVIGKFTLEPEFADIFKLKNNNRGEIIWAINFSGTLGQGWTTNQFIVRLMPTTRSDNGTKNGQGWERPTNYLYNSFAAGDERKSTTFITEFEGEVFSGPFIQKYWDREAEPGKQNGESDADFIYLRYADVLLMYAEALNEINNGPDNTAYDAINQVRNRAGLGDLSTGLSYQDFKDAVLQERQWEFVMEGQRWYDLVRMGKLKEQVLLSKPTANVQDFHVLFPIPQKEIYYNPNLTQNTGYY